MKEKITQTSPKNQPWHARSAEDTLKNLNSDQKKGLSSNEAKKRLDQYGSNVLSGKERASAWIVFLEQFKNTLIIILFLAASVSGILGHGIEAITIGVIILFAVLIGFFQELKAGKAIEALRGMAAPLATVLRNGEEEQISAPEVVPGDIIYLKAGDRVPADSRLLSVMNLKADEAGLTGESIATEKHDDLLCPENAVVGDRRNMVFSGTNIAYGRGSAVVVATGMNTEFGSIASMLQNVKKERTPLEKNLDRVGKILTKAAFAIVILIVTIGLFRGQEPLEMILFGIALAVAVVPEALPAVVTISLAIGVQRMAKRKALVRHLPAVETLGSTQIICTDKTGTLTKDEMTVRKVFLGGEIELEVTGTGYEPKGELQHKGKSYAPTSTLQLFLKAAVLCSDAKLIYSDEEGWEMKGDPTEGALVTLAGKVGMQKEPLDETFKRIAEIPFSSESKRMTTLHEGPEGFVAYSKGAAEIILTFCTRYQTEEGVKPLTKEVRQAFLSAIYRFGEAALRVIGIAYVPTQGQTLEQAEKDMIFLGLVGMIDPPRPEVKTAIEVCQNAGIRPIMITGDHPLTATAIAKELGILQEGGKVVTGVELTAMSQEELHKEIEKIGVFARVSPEHKLRVVNILQQQGHIVAMTGDGINDAPALKKANIGIAMGITGTDVSKEAAAMTLMDDNFASIVAAVEEGRVIFGNIKKYLMYLLSSNIGEIGLMMFTSLAGLPLPLSTVQLLYINLVTDGLPALALAIDPAEKDVMQQRPSKTERGVFSRPVISLMLMGGLWSAIVNFGLFYWALHSGKSLAQAMTLVFATLMLIEFLKAYNFRSDHNSVFQRPFANVWLNRAILLELALLAIVMYLPFFQKPFGIAPLSPNEWLLAAGLAATVVPVLELSKWVLRKKKETLKLSPLPMGS